MSNTTLVMPVVPQSAKFDLSQNQFSGMKRFAARLLARNFLTFGDLNKNEKISLSIKRKVDLHLTYLGLIPGTNLRYYRIARQYSSVGGETHEDVSITFLDSKIGWLPMIYKQAPINYREIVRWFVEGELVMDVGKIRQIDGMVNQWANIFTRLYKRRKNACGGGAQQPRKVKVIIKYL
ncbi:MAG: hypothetical protein ACTSYI_09330 [Promethearchaeota archaeon]